MTFGERIKKLRKDLNLTQQKFADRIGTTQNVIANYESGRREPSAAAFNNICKTFGISEEWLRTGKGEMFIPSPEEDINELIRQHRLDDLDRQILLEFIKLTDDERAVFKKYLRNLVKHSAGQGSDRGKTIEEEARAEADRYYEQLVAEKKRESEASFARESAGA